MRCQGWLKQTPSDFRKVLSRAPEEPYSFLDGGHFMSRSVPMERGSSRAMGPHGSGTRTAQAHPTCSMGTCPGSPRSPSARTERRWSPAAGTRLRASGTRTAQALPLCSMGTSRRLPQSPSVRTERRSSPAAGTRLRASGSLITISCLKRFGTPPAIACPSAGGRNSLENLPLMPSRVILAVELRSPDAVAGLRISHRFLRQRCG